MTETPWAVGACVASGLSFIFYVLWAIFRGTSVKKPVTKKVGADVILPGRNTGYKLLNEYGRSLLAKEPYLGVIQYDLSGEKVWQEIPGNGSYVAIDAGIARGVPYGTPLGGKIVAYIEVDPDSLFDAENKIHYKPFGVWCFRRIRVLKYAGVLQGGFEMLGSGMQQELLMTDPSLKNQLRQRGIYHG